MKTQDSIPAGKVQRATRFVTTGLKVGGNYLKHYARKALDPEITREELHQDNAADIYATLSELKGSALKVAQMMSMDRNLLPRAYSDRFQMAQYSAPPLSGPLVMKTFTGYFGRPPQQLFDSFEMEAANAASIGQVHRAVKDGRALAVKVQYPGVARSVRSDLKMVKPFAVRLMNLNERDVDKYMQEVETKLLEETDYRLELRRSQEISAACGHIAGLVFPQYYPELSSERVLTMDWLDGRHLDEFLQADPPQAVRDRIGQALWDFYDFQVHVLRKVHADPHPGNFLMRPDGTLGVIDFGCVKEIPESYYTAYFTLINPDNLQDAAMRERIFGDLEFLHPQDTPAERTFYAHLFITMIELLGRPFHGDTFDFGDDTYFQAIYDYADHLTNLKELRESKVARGSKDSLYINRTYYGLYSMLNQLRAVVRTSSPAWIWQPAVPAGR